MLVGVGNVSGVVFLDQSGRAELTSLWRTELADTVAAMCSESSISFQQLVQNLSPLTVRWDIAEGGGVIQRSLRNVNNPQDYRDLLTDLDSPSTDGMSSV
jgi:molybdopterin-guanine dinucleotide biosynthesis protein A